MNKYVAGVIFASIFFSSYYLMNYYAFLKISKVLTFRFLWLIILLFGITFPLAMFSERAFHNSFTHILYYIGGVWLGTLFMFTCVYLIIDGVGFFTKLPNLTTLYALIFIVILIIYGIINAQIIRTTNVDIPVSNLEKELKIVQLSDIHVGAVHKKDFLQKIVDKTNSQNPDVVVITGDLFDGSDGIPKDEIEPLSKLKSKTFFVTGNHENYLGKTESIDAVKNQNITVLEDQVKLFKGIQLVGISYSLNEVDKSNDKLKNLNLSKNKPVIVLYHQPILQTGADLQLSGHTHNGQLIPFKAFVRIMFKYISGLHNINDSKLYISQGLGTWGPPMRIFTKSEIVVINLKKA